jgi:hypothetical protein
VLMDLVDQSRETGHGLSGCRSGCVALCLGYWKMRSGPTGSNEWLAAGATRTSPRAPGSAGGRARVLQGTQTLVDRG